MTEQITTRLKESDANGDGLLSKEEVAGPMQRRFEDMDTNGDGSLDAAEQEAMVQRIAERMSEFNGRGGRGRGEGGRRPFGGDRRRRD